jgi:hypothetical protein
MTKKKLSDHLPDWKDDGVNGRIKEEAYDKIIEWLALPDEETRTANHHLITQNRPSGTIDSAVYRSNPDRIEMIADHKDWTTARVFDLPAFALFKLLTAFGGRFRMNDHKKGNLIRPDQTLTFPAVNLGIVDNVALARLVWNSTTPSPVTQIGHERNPSDGNLCDTFTDWRLINLQSNDAKPKRKKRNASKRGTTPRDRKAATKAALAYRTKREELRVKEVSRNEKRLMLLPKSKAYQNAIERCFALLDGLKVAVIAQRASKSP